MSGSNHEGFKDPSRNNSAPVNTNAGHGQQPQNIVSQTAQGPGQYSAMPTQLANSTTQQPPTAAPATVSTPQTTTLGSGPLTVTTIPLTTLSRPAQGQSGHTFQVRQSLIKILNPKPNVLDHRSTPASTSQ